MNETTGVYNWSKLVDEVIKEYKEALKIDSENTDSLFFILEEIGNREAMSEERYNHFEKIVYKRVEKLGL